MKPEKKYEDFIIAGRILRKAKKEILEKTTLTKHNLIITNYLQNAINHSSISKIELLEKEEELLKKELELKK